MCVVYVLTRQKNNLLLYTGKKDLHKPEKQQHLPYSYKAHTYTNTSIYLKIQ